MLESISFLMLAVVIICFLVSIPTQIGYIIFKKLKKTKFKSIGIIVLLVSVIFTVYSVFTAIYPNDSFYFDDFETVTFRKPPNSANIISKSASYPDIHGDYCSAALIDLSKDDYKSLYNELNKDGRFERRNENNHWSSELNQVTYRREDQLGITFTQRTDYGHNLTIIFLRDQKTIAMHRCEN